MPYPLEIDGKQLQALLRTTGEKLAAHLDGLESAPTAPLDRARRMARSLVERPPPRGRPFPRVLDLLIDRAALRSLNTASPGYMGFIPGGGLPAAALADLISGVINRYTGLHVAAPGLVQLEVNVLRWLCAWLGYGPQAGGLLVSGGSVANLIAVVAARDAGADSARAVLYTSSLAHHSVMKAAHVAGFPAQRVRALPTDERFRLRAATVQQAIEQDLARGLLPRMVVASAGTTALGSVDPLDELADLCEANGLWFHVDGAYGGCFVLTERGRQVLSGIGRADSVTLDPHKGLFLPYGTGAVLVKDRETLRRAFSSSSDYLPPPSDDPDRWDFADLGPELSRPYRGLRLWLPLKMYGVNSFREALEEKLDLARQVAEQLATLPGVRMVSPPTLSLLAFRVEPPGHPDWEGLNRRIIARVNLTQRVYLTGATIEEQGERRFVIRVCVLSFRTHADRIQILMQALEQAIADPRG